MVVFYHQHIDNDYTNQAKYLDGQNETHKNYEDRGNTLGLCKSSERLA